MLLVPHRGMRQQLANVLLTTTTSHATATWTGCRYAIHRQQRAPRDADPAHTGLMCVDASMLVAPHELVGGHLGG